ncbi:hypothetical protein AGABI2DRAFT_209318 [Agaricus bisporus var. bisporus H97]|uniref:hypothetical protein n=1 Tax=Agaricus bisporus var. bisporus (strain H97 / ATCC MYA-4626 / FGSC 10389) TaxID=936046 RepID=UPI00029F66FF|nr:hypothetical protein AGABI2DRAFT_209318 [Agaricus bisporus var. bisporus H97]EKV43787.1 hypothetical protein AGABI2DRAFT_209318 [Agaricus bisporus var. bisporus H97]
MINLRLRDILVAGFCIILHLVYRSHKRRLLPPPPGPTRWPVVGSILSMTLNYAHISYQKFGKKLGAKFLYYEVFNQPIIVINDVQVAQELLEKRSAIYSSRPQVRILSEGIGMNRFFAIMPYGDEWRAQRRMFQQYFGPRHFEQQLEMHERMLRFVRRGLLPNLLTSPQDFHEHLRNCIGGFSISIAYGLPVQRQHDSRVRFSGTVFGEMIAAAGSGKLVIHFISSLLQDIPDWMPGSGFKKAARDLRSLIEKLVEDPYQAGLELLDEGNPQESFVATSLAKGRNYADFEGHVNRLKYTATQFFGGAAETTMTVFSTFVLMMLKNRDVQCEVQRELDSVIGSDRMPTMSDLSRLPYLSAVIKETLRWNPVAPLSVPRMTTSEDVYDGYYIPKDCIVLTNIYAMLHDEDTYPEPEEFKPERFIKNGVLRDDVPDPETIATFGFGRRICPGSHIVLPFIHLIAASILCLFDILPEVDAEGNPINVVPKFAPSSLTSEPYPFPCKIVPRGDRNVKELLKEYIGNEPI